MANVKSVRNISIFAALFLSWALFTFLAPSFLGARNLSMLAIEFAITAVLALGMLLIILTGNIDLSVGSGLGLIGGVASVLVFNYSWPSPLAMAAGLALATAIWAAMGGVIAREKVPSFIMTLGGLLIFKGLFWMVIGNATVPVVQGDKVNLYSILTTYYFPQWAGYTLAAILSGGILLSAVVKRMRRKKYGLKLEEGEVNFLKVFITCQGIFLFVVVMNMYRGIPLPAVILGAVAFAIHVITTHTPFGRYLYAIGGNEEAAVISGIPVAKVVTGAFAIMGVVVALSGYLQTAYAGASTTTTGNLMELDAIAACVIGGTSLKGGRGTVLGVLFGSLLMASLLNGMTLLAFSPELKFICRGVVLTLAVWMDVRLSR